MNTYRLMDGASGRPGIGSSGTQPPSASTSFSGTYSAGLAFKVTSPGLYLNGFWWYVPASNSSTAAQKFALWKITGTNTGTLVSGANATSAALTAGQWNFIPLNPVLLTQNTPYAVVTSMSLASPQGFPTTAHQFGSGNPYAAGITNGPLYAYHSGEIDSMPQQPYNVSGGNDPSLVFPVTNDLDDLLWLDVSVTDAPSFSSTNRFWPNNPPAETLPGHLTGNDAAIIANEFSVSAAGTLTNVWHYSPPGANALPTRATIWQVVGAVAVVDVTSPTWSGAAGSGWIRCTNLPSGFTLTPGARYKVSVYQSANGVTWFEAISSYWSDNIANGILTGYSNTNATSPGNGTYNSTTFAYPASTNGEAYFVDVEVTAPSSYRLWPTTNGPTTATSYSGGFISGTGFCVTKEAWLEGYWWWVAGAGGQNTGATKCALWQISASGGFTLVPGSVVTSGTLIAGQWNYIPLPTPIPLSLGGFPAASPKSASSNVGGPGVYVAAIGCNGPFPDTPNYWGATQPGAAGITNGPLTAYSASGGSLPAPFTTGTPQGAFTTGGSDPSVSPPNGSSGTDNFWVDVQVRGTPPIAYSGVYRLWPNLPVIGGTANNDTSLAVSATAFILSRPCALKKIWMFNPSGSTGLPSRCAIWKVASQTVVSGTDSGTSPAWKNSTGGSASAGDGWIYVDYSGANVILPAGTYLASFYNGNGVKCYMDSVNYFFTGTDPVGSASVGGAGWNGISQGGGILTAPNVANGPQLIYDNSSGTFSGQSAYLPAGSGWAYPGEFEASSDWGETRWADVEVILATSGSGLLMANFP